MKCLKPERQARVPRLTWGQRALASTFSSCPPVLRDSWGMGVGGGPRVPLCDMAPPDSAPTQEGGVVGRLAPLALLTGGRLLGGQGWREESQPDARSPPSCDKRGDRER